MKINKRRIKEFFTFMRDRHRIFKKRYVKKETGPWTTDETLRDCKFTNIFRELDRGTIYWYLNIMKPYKSYDINPMEFLFQTIAYRLCNRVETFDIVGLPSIEKNIMSYIDKLMKLQKKQPVWTSAHLVAFGPGIKRFDGYRLALRYTRKNIADLHDDILGAKSLQEVFKVLTRIKGVGGFIGYEICCDLIYAGLVPLDWINTWCNVGPGAKPAIDILFPGRDRSHLYYCDRLYQNQERYIKEAGIKFPMPEWTARYNGKRELSLRTIEHSCCEWRKFVHANEGKGRSRVKFTGSKKFKKDWYYDGLKELGFLK